MKIIRFLQLIRYKNVLLFAFVQGLFKLALGSLTPYAEFVSIFLLIIATVCIAAAGNIINDIFDVETDKINKPKKVIISQFISKKNAFIYYVIFNLIGLLSGLYLSFKILHKPLYSLVFIFIILLLYFYSKYFKKIAILGNLIVSFLIAQSILMVYFFHYFRVHFSVRWDDFILIIIYASFAFILNFIREIVKDIEDINGDYNQNMKTLPILIGKKRTQTILFYISLVPFFFIIFLVSPFKNIPLQIYSLVFLIIPLGYFIYHIKEVKTKKQFHRLSTLLKVIMLFGILSVILLKI